MAVFKSLPEFYEKEKDGRKPNTFRKYSYFDLRFIGLLNGSDKIIQIENTKTEEIFTREITDVTFWDGWVIISWKHIEELGDKDNIIQKELMEIMGIDNENN